jgi:hypothetical protein
MVVENDKVSVMRELEHYAREKNQKLGEGQQQGWHQWGP